MTQVFLPANTRTRILDLMKDKKITQAPLRLTDQWSTTWHKDLRESRPSGHTFRVWRESAPIFCLLEG